MAILDKMINGINFLITGTISEHEGKAVEQIECTFEME
jgi:hypothetical protein